ncbi:hypothetical protein ACXR2T_10630 [Leucobacter sp. HY1910]
MGKRIPGKLLPHRDLVTVEPYLGGGANGRHYGPPVTVRRALIVDADQLVRDQYDAEVSSGTTLYFERHELAELPSPETRVTVRAGTADERVTHVIRCARYDHPRIADLLEVSLE